MKYRIAVPITATNEDGALRDMDAASKVADIIELRIDYMREPNLERLLRHSPIPKIVTNRHKDEGGRFEGSEEERHSYLRQAIDLGAEYIDVESRHMPRKPFDKKSTKSIVSHHDFVLTPNPLSELYRHIRNQGADIVKIATKAKDFQDSKRMLDLISSTSADGDIIGICMGEFGSTTRVLGPLYGGYLTFASLEEGKASAPGQLTVEDLKRIWKLTHVE